MIYKIFILLQRYLEYDFVSVGRVCGDFAFVQFDDCFCDGKTYAVSARFEIVERVLTVVNGIHRIIVVFENGHKHV